MIPYIFSQLWLIVKIFSYLCYMSKQHFHLPNDMTKGGKLTPNDLLVYICIKSYMNKNTKTCFPSLKTLSGKSGFSIPTIRKSIKSLEEED